MPQKFWQRQNLCWYLHDVIISIFLEALEKDLIKTEFIFNNDEERERFEKTECIYEWLKENGREEKFVIATSQNIAHRLLGDFLNYIYESLSNLERGKMSIAYDLLRKPFKDNLMYLEWLLYDDSEICSLVYNGEIKEYTLAGRDGISKEKLKEIINYNIEKNSFKDFLLKEEIYNIRYDANSLNSMELMWNKATHLVTTRKQNKTKDFNYLFLNEIDYNNYWEFYYSKVPMLLLYAVGVVENIFDKYYRKISDNSKFYNWSLIVGKFIGSISNSYEDADKFTYLINGKLYLLCEECKAMVEIEKSESYQFYQYLDVLCPECKKKINITKYFFLDEKENED